MGIALINLESVLPVASAQVVALRPVLIGATVGLVLGGAPSGMVPSMMFGIGVHDPITFVSVPLFLFGVACAATLIPA